MSKIDTDKIRIGDTVLVELTVVSVPPPTAASSPSFAAAGLFFPSTNVIGVAGYQNPNALGSPPVFHVERAKVVGHTPRTLAVGDDVWIDSAKAIHGVIRAIEDGEAWVKRGHPGSGHATYDLTDLTRRF